MMLITAVARKVALHDLNVPFDPSIMAYASVISFNNDPRSMDEKKKACAETFN